MQITFRPSSVLAARFPHAQKAKILLQNVESGAVLWSAYCAPGEEIHFYPAEHAGSLSDVRLRVDVLNDESWTRRVVTVRIQNVLRASRLRVFNPTDSSANVNRELVAGISMLDWIEFPTSWSNFVGAFKKQLRRLRAAKTTLEEARSIKNFVQAYEDLIGYTESSRYSNLLFMLKFYAEHNIARLQPHVYGGEVTTIASKYREIAQASPKFPAALLAGGFSAIECQDHAEAGRLFDASWAASRSINRSIGLMKSGPATFSASHSWEALVVPAPEFDLSRRSPRDVTILLSADVAYLRKYAMRLAFQMVVVPNCAYHFHLIDTMQNVEAFLTDFESALDMCRRMRQSTAPVPSWSWSREDLPTGVPNSKTYYACARYLHLRRFNDVLDSHIWVQDADSFLNSSPDKWISKFRNYDVTLTSGVTFDRFIPWFAYLGFSTFISNTEPARAWSDSVREILLTKLPAEESWLLDQTALFLAEVRSKNLEPVINILTVDVDDSIVSHFHSSLAHIVEGP